MHQLCGESDQGASAESCRLTCRIFKGSPVFRVGGDEFVVIYEGYSDTEVFDMAKDLKERILKRAVEHKFTKSFMKIVTVSQGIFWGKPTDGTTAWNFLHAADALLYRAKNKSRNSIMLGHVLGDDDEKPWEG